MHGDSPSDGGARKARRTTIPMRPRHADSTTRQYTDDIRHKQPGRWSLGFVVRSNDKPPRPIEHLAQPLTTVVARELVGAKRGALPLVGGRGQPRRRCRKQLVPGESETVMADL